jgi:hypothetical protein
MRRMEHQSGYRARNGLDYVSFRAATGRWCFRIHFQISDSLSRSSDVVMWFDCPPLRYRFFKVRSSIFLGPVPVQPQLMHPENQSMPDAGYPLCSLREV